MGCVESKPDPSERGGAPPTAKGKDTQAALVRKKKRIQDRPNVQMRR